jgi:two-component sensor histidine kinase
VIAQIYNRLRLSQNLGGEVDVGVFVRDLCDDFRRAHLELRPISLEVEVQVHTLALRRAIVVGFVLNELLTNATKYGFRDDVSGAIVVRFLSGPAGQLVLRVEDSGDGLGSDDAPKGTGIGQRIVRSMASQLHGAFSLEREGGWTVAELAFPAADSEP